MTEQEKAPLESAPKANKLPLWWLVVHWGIIINFALQVGYGAYMVFVVVVPKGVKGPLAQAATKVPFELMTTRRLYASETWVAIVGLSLYLAITEIAPRLWLRRGQ